MAALPSKSGASSTGSSGRGRPSATSCRVQICQPSGPSEAATSSTLWGFEVASSSVFTAASNIQGHHQLGNHGGFEPATPLPWSQFAAAGLHARHHVITQSIGDCFVVNALLTERLAVHLKLLSSTQHSAGSYRTDFKVGWPVWAHAGELLMEVFDHIRGITRIGEGLKQGWIRHPTMVGQPRRLMPCGETVRGPTSATAP